MSETVPVTPAPAQVQTIGQPQIDAIKVLINTAHVCQSRGALNLKEAQVVGAAVDKFVLTDDNKAQAEPISRPKVVTEI